MMHVYYLHAYIFVYSSQNDVGVIYNPPDLDLMGKTIKMKFSIKVEVESGTKGQYLHMMEEVGSTVYTSS